MLDEQGTEKSFIAGIRAKKMAGKMEKPERELSSVEETIESRGESISRCGMDKPR